MGQAGRGGRSAEDCASAGGAPGPGLCGPALRPVAVGGSSGSGADDGARGAGAEVRDPDPVEEVAEVGVGAEGRDPEPVEEVTEAGDGAEVRDPEPVEEAAEAGHEEGEEALVPRCARSPFQPTKAEWEAHQATHLPYRSWCRFCVEGRCDNPPHRGRPAELEQPAVQEVHMDYCFVRREGEEHATTVLVLKHRQSRAVRCWAVPRKGGAEAVAAELANEGIRGSGSPLPSRSR